MNFTASHIWSTIQIARVISNRKSLRFDSTRAHHGIHERVRIYAFDLRHVQIFSLQEKKKKNIYQPSLREFPQNQPDNSVTEIRKLINSQTCARGTEREKKRKKKKRKALHGAIKATSRTGRLSPSRRVSNDN